MLIISAWALRCLFSYDRQCKKPQRVGRTIRSSTLYFCLVPMYLVNIVNG